MMRKVLPALALLAAIATPVLADEPGPGGTRPPVPKDGREIYVFYCQACHMDRGQGAVGAGVFPALANNPRLGTTAYAITIVAKGRGGMPWFSDQLTPTQLAQVITYMRTSFGNNYPEPVTAADVAPFVKPPTREP